MNFIVGRVTVFFRVNDSVPTNWFTASGSGVGEVSSGTLAVGDAVCETGRVALLVIIDYTVTANCSASQGIRIVFETCSNITTTITVTVVHGRRIAILCSIDSTVATNRYAAKREWIVFE